MGVASNWCHPQGHHARKPPTTIPDEGQDIPKLETKLADITDAIVDCYRGCCQLCDEHSYVCSQEKPWFRKYLDNNPGLSRRRAFIHPQGEDLPKLHNLIAIRLGPGAIHNTVTNSTQDECEASNKGIKKTVPGYIGYHRNYSGCIHSVVHSMNHGNDIGHNWTLWSSKRTDRWYIICELDHGINGQKDKIPAAI